MQEADEKLPSGEEIRRLLESVDSSRDQLILRLLAELGCRPRDIARLQTQDIAPTSLRIAGKDVTVPEALGNALVAYASGRDTPYVFAPRAEKPITIRRIRQLAAEHSQRVLGRALTPRQLRYAAIRQHFADDAPMEHIRTAAGIGRPRLAQLRQQFRPEGEPDA